MGRAVICVRHWWGEQWYVLDIDGESSDMCETLWGELWYVLDIDGESSDMCEALWGELWYVLDIDGESDVCQMLMGELMICVTCSQG